MLETTEGKPDCMTLYARRKYDLQSMKNIANWLAASVESSGRISSSAQKTVQNATQVFDICINRVSPKQKTIWGGGGGEGG